MNGQPHARLNSYHGPKRQLLGNQAGHAAPAWRNVHELPGQTVALAKNRQNVQDQGSKILLSRLPVDVGEKEVEDLFKKTVGPLRECFLVYNSAGKSKGMAVVAFQRPGDAAAAKAKYDGKIVDGRKPLKIEIVTDTVTPAPVNVKPPTPSLLTRLGAKPLTNTAVKNAPAPTYVPFILLEKASYSQARHPNQARAANTASATAVPAGTKKVRYKKGPKRIKKQVQNARLTVDQLDKEMEDYRAAADTSGL
ncbi:hypothetical protein BDZ94DRAFT_1177637 [Collybia nuda]|uniref:RRM domain-containing protein n=1 Tax=Collybia nuda TaxID=64659 RepID=A0A9P5XVV2_9AGAR|nr:hypothetical protein BDZ94DRAFT_1177637 [Collybia nuda]